MIDFFMNFEPRTNTGSPAADFWVWEITSAPPDSGTRLEQFRQEPLQRFRQNSTNAPFKASQKRYKLRSSQSFLNRTEWKSSSLYWRREIEVQNYCLNLCILKTYILLSPSLLLQWIFLHIKANILSKIYLCLSFKILISEGID